MENEWNTKTLGEIAVWLSGGTPAKDNPDYWNGDIPWISAKSMTDTRLNCSEITVTDNGVQNGARLVDEGAILILVRGSMLHQRVPIGIATCPLTFNQDIKVLVVKPDVEPEFLLYFLLAKEPLLLSMVEYTGIGAGKLDTGLLKALEINIPPLQEQRSIIHILGTLDDKIELNRRMNETLEAIARAIFKSWFIDFDPVRAKSEGRDPGLPKHIADLFPDLFGDSENGEIPKGWAVKEANEIAKLNSWTLNRRDEIDPILYIEISEVSQGNINNIVIYKRGTEPSRARRRLRHGDTVLSTVRPERGAYFLALNPPNNLVASTGFSVITPEKAPWSFVHAALTQPDIFARLGQLADGGAYPAINPKEIGKLRISYPLEPEIVEVFDSICAPLYLCSNNNRREINILKDIRDTLLPKLISGQVRIKDADKFLERVS